MSDVSVDNVNNVKNITDIRLDIALQGALERSGLESLPLASMRLNETYENIEFIRISHIGYERLNADNDEISDSVLLDYSQFLSAIACANKTFVYMIENDTSGVSLYLGIESNGDASPFATQIAQHDEMGVAKSEGVSIDAAQKAQHERVNASLYNDDTGGGGQILQNLSF